MISRINIKNYKLFKDFSLEKLSNFVLISGKNNCGKTSILESIFTPLDCANPAMFIRPLSWRGMNTFDIDATSVFAPAFNEFDLKKSICFEYHLNGSEKKLSYKFCPSNVQPIRLGDNKMEINNHLETSIGGIEISYGIKNPQTRLLTGGLKGFELQNFQGLQEYNNIRAVFLSSTIPLQSEEDSRRYSELEKYGKTDDLTKSLQIVEPKLQDLRLISVGNKSVIHGDVGIGIKIPIALMGQGMVRLMTILLAISEAKNGVVLIDEMESGFHHSILPRVWEIITRYAKQNKTQVIATTHSWELIRSAVQGVLPEFKDDFKYMRVERVENTFKTKDYNFEQLNVALEAELEVR